MSDVKCLTGDFLPGLRGGECTALCLGDDTVPGMDEASAAAAPGIGRGGGGALGQIGGGTGQVNTVGPVGKSSGSSYQQSLTVSGVKQLITNPMLSRDKT